jgi:hypothetical protein
MATVHEEWLLNQKVVAEAKRFETNLDKSEMSPSPFDELRAGSSGIVCSRVSRT